jgi:hypothetical protein
MARWFLFSVTIALGAVIGLLYGWVVNPLQVIDATPQTLRADYRSDYVLMVAEVYQAEADLGLASRQLAFLADTTPGEAVRQALLFGNQAGYPQLDIYLLEHLAADLQTWHLPAGDIEP